MPIPPCSQDQPAAVCCDRLFTVTQQAALIAGLAVRNCFGDICSEIPIYVSHGEPVGGGDYVAAWLSSITTPGIPTGRTFFVTSRLTINVVICLAGFPRIRIQGGDLAFYVSFDNQNIWALQAGALIDALDDGDAEGGILMVNGSPTDNNASGFKSGAHSVIDDSGYPILAEFDTPDWSPDKAQDWVAGQLTQFEGDIAAVYAANDGTASGVIAAIHAANRMARRR